MIFLLQIFNSRTCQLVLGAGALQLVGLKTISTKNLGRKFNILITTTTKLLMYLYVVKYLMV